MVSLRTPTGMTLVEVQALPEYSVLTSKQQVFVTTLLEKFITSGGALDWLGAVCAAYAVGSHGNADRSRDNAMIMVCQLRRSPRVLAVLRQYSYHGMEERARAVAEIDEQIESAVPGSTVAAQLLAMKNSLRFGSARTMHSRRHQGISNVPAPEDAPQFEVGEIVNQDGKSYEVVSLRSDGSPVTREID